MANSVRFTLCKGCALWMSLRSKRTMRVSPSVGIALLHKSAGVRRNALAVLPLNDEAAKSIVHAVLDSRSCAMTSHCSQVRLADAVARCGFAASARSRSLPAGRRSAKPDRWILDCVDSAAASSSDALPADALSQMPWTRVKTLEVAAIVAGSHVVAEHCRSRQSTHRSSRWPWSDPQQTRPTADGNRCRLVRGWPDDVEPTLSDAPRSDRSVSSSTRLSPSARQLVEAGHALGQRSGFEQQAAEIAASLARHARERREADDQRDRRRQQLVELPQADDAEPVERTARPDHAAHVARAWPRRCSMRCGESESPDVGAAIVERLARLDASRAAGGHAACCSAAASGRRDLLDGRRRRRRSAARRSVARSEAGAGRPSRSSSSPSGPRSCSPAAAACRTPIGRRCSTNCCRSPKQTGDAAAGKLVFKKHCAKCHTHCGEGTRSAPTSPAWPCIRRRNCSCNIIDPSRSVEGNFRVYTVVTDDGPVLNGLLASEIARRRSNSSTPRARSTSLLRDEIEEADRLDEVADARGLREAGHAARSSPTCSSSSRSAASTCRCRSSKAATVVSTQGHVLQRESRRRSG